MTVTEGDRGKRVMSGGCDRLRVDEGQSCKRLRERRYTRSRGPVTRSPSRAARVVRSSLREAAAPSRTQIRRLIALPDYSDCANHVKPRSDHLRVLEERARGGD